MTKVLWGYKTVATLPDSSGMYRVRFGRLSDLGQWDIESREEFEKRESVRNPTACFKLTREEYDAFAIKHPHGYTAKSGDVDGPVGMVDEHAPI